MVGRTRGMKILTWPMGLTQSRSSWPLQPDFCLCSIFPQRPLSGVLVVPLHTHILCSLSFIFNIGLRALLGKCLCTPQFRLCFCMLGFVFTLSVYCITKKNMIDLLLYQYLFLFQKKSSRENVASILSWTQFPPRMAQNTNKESMSWHGFSFPISSLYIFCKIKGLGKVKI